MKILIIAYHFYPDVSPRSFRTFELVKQLAKEGHEVTVLLPESDFDYKGIYEKYNFMVDFTDYQKASNVPLNNAPKKENSFLKKTIKLLLKNLTYCIFPSGRGVKFYFYAVYKKLKTYRESQDMVISIAMPFETHLGAAMAFKKNKIFDNTVKVADYGDPLYGNPGFKFPHCPIYLWMDKFIASKFKYFTIPTEKALAIHTKFKDKRFIKIIPQGFDFSDIRIAKYVPNINPVFGYAGVFYEDIRDPRPLLECLLDLDKKKIDFKFIIYTKIDNENNMKLLEKYKNILGDKLQINSVIPRLDVIYELSKMDFLINIENLSSSQVPSKTIDYALTKRPIFAFNELNFSEDLFMKFMNQNYKQSIDVDIDRYNIITVCKQFLNLCSEG